MTFCLVYSFLYRKERLRQSVTSHLDLKHQQQRGFLSFWRFWGCWGIRLRSFSFCPPYSELKDPDIKRHCPNVTLHVHTCTPELKAEFALHLITPTFPIAAISKSVKHGSKPENHSDPSFLSAYEGCCASCFLFKLFFCKTSHLESWCSQQVNMGFRTSIR